MSTGNLSMSLIVLALAVARGVGEGGYALPPFTICIAFFFLSTLLVNSTRTCRCDVRDDIKSSQNARRE